MTREEAIALLNEQYETCKRIYDCSADQRKSYPNVPQFMEALGMALTALRLVTREQVEKMRGKWIDARYSSKDVPKCQCSICGKKYVGLETDFCQYCGAPMTYEAVDILWKRLEEALRDNHI